MEITILINYSVRDDTFDVVSNLNEQATITIMEEYLQTFAPGQIETGPDNQDEHYYVFLIWDTNMDMIKCAHNCGNSITRDAVITVASRRKMEIPNTWDCDEC